MAIARSALRFHASCDDAGVPCKCPLCSELAELRELRPVTIVSVSPISEISEPVTFVKLAVNGESVPVVEAAR